MWHLVLASLLGAQTPAFVGEVRITKGALAPVVGLKTDTEAFEVVGEFVGEIGKLQSAHLEVVGSLENDGKRIRVSHYRILEVNGAKQPVVGELIETGNGLALRDGQGSPIPLSLAPRTLQNLRYQVGAKLWAAGNVLISGELKVSRYGILRDPPKKATDNPSKVP